MPNEADDLSDAPSESEEFGYYKCCKSKKFKGSICIQCGGAFHRSCSARYKCRTIDAFRVICGNCVKSEVFSESDNRTNKILQVENHYLKKILCEYEEKINLLKEVNQTLKEKVINMENQSSVSLCNKIAYNEIVKSGDSAKTHETTKKLINTTEQNIRSKNLPSLKINSKNNIKGSEILKILKSKIQPRNMGINIKETKLINDGVLLRCETEENLNKLKSEISEKCDQLIVAPNKKYNPRIIIKFVNIDVANDDLYDDIVSHNTNILPSDIKIIKTIQLKSNKFKHIVLEISPSAYSNIAKNGYKISTAWEIFKVENHLYIKKCFQCNGFGHIKKDCTSLNPICPKCSGDHAANECSATFRKCCNCTKYNESVKEFSKFFPTDHSAMDKICPLYIKKCDLLSSKVIYENYNEQY